MQIEKMAKNLLRRFYAEEESEEEKNLELQKESYPEYTKRYYFFSTLKNPDGTRGIDFNRLQETLKSADPQGKKSLVKKLQSGLVAQNGDNFKWDSIAVKTNKYNGETHKEYVVYYGKLTPAGRRTNNENIIPEDLGKNINMEQFVKEHNIYVNKSGVTDAVYLAPDQGAFLEKDATDQDMRFILKSRGTYKGEMGWEAFRSEYMSNYRVWFEEKRELRKPDLSIPTEDNFLQPGQPYRGSPQDLQALLKATGTDLGNLDKQEEQPPGSLGEKMEEEKKNPQQGEEQPESTFTPVDEQKPTSQKTVRDKFKNAASKDSKIKEIKKEDPGANYYVGDFSILQDLVRRQHKKMKLRKDAAISTVMPATNTTTTTKNKQVSVPVNFSKPDETKKNLQQAQKAVDEVDRLHKDLKQKMEDIGQSMDRSAAERVVASYFRKV